IAAVVVPAAAAAALPPGILSAGGPARRLRAGRASRSRPAPVAGFLARRSGGRGRLLPPTPRIGAGSPWGLVPGVLNLRLTFEDLAHPASDLIVDDAHVVLNVDVHLFLKNAQDLLALHVQLARQ